MKLGEWMKNSRKGRTQGVLAAEMLVDVGTISGWETGAQEPTPAMMKYWAMIVGVDVGEALARREKKAIPPPAQIQQPVPLWRRHLSEHVSIMGTTVDDWMARFPAWLESQSPEFRSFIIATVATYGEKRRQSIKDQEAIRRNAESAYTDFVKRQNGEENPKGTG